MAYDYTPPLPGMFTDDLYASPQQYEHAPAYNGSSLGGYPHWHYPSADGLLDHVTADRKAIANMEPSHLTRAYDEAPWQAPREIEAKDSRFQRVDSGVVFATPVAGLTSHAGLENGSVNPPISISGKSGKSGRPASSIRSRRTSFVPYVCQIPKCGKAIKTRSDETKHNKQHERPYRCPIPSCPRSKEKEGFGTPNDLNRHKRDKHKMPDAKASGHICSECPDTTKWWPRKDNFCAHVTRRHGDSDLEKVLEASFRKHKPDDTTSEAGTLQSNNHYAQSDLDLLDYSGDLPFYQPSQYQGSAISHRTFEFPYPSPVQSPVWLARCPRRTKRKGCEEGETKEPAKKTCKMCGSQVNSLEKHLVRHDTGRYFCTDIYCFHDSSGSKYDWRRHEETLHSLPQGWLCQEIQKDGSGGICNRFFDMSDRARQHLEGPDHLMAAADAEIKLEEIYLGHKGRERFWCGFCVQVIANPGADREAAYDRRFEHIGKHLDTKGGFRGEDWVCVFMQKRKKDITKEERKQLTEKLLRPGCRDYYDPAAAQRSRERREEAARLARI